MRLIRLAVNGVYGCQYDFEKVNVLLGENNTGKSTFLKLILYSLGAPTKSFIDEIAKDELCDNVSLDIEFRTGKKVRILRKLPSSEAIIVTPIKNENEIVNDEITAFTAEEFSDYLLENEGYSTEKIVYSKDKKASFRFYFLLRALYVDQDTSARSVLSDLDMGQDYFSSQPIIKKSIIEKLLGKDNSELQRIRMELQTLSKEYALISEKINYLIKEKDEIEQKEQIVKNKINAELEEIEEEKRILSDKQYEKISSVQKVNDFDYSKEDIAKQEKLNQLIQRRQVLILEIKDLEDILKSLNEDIVLLKYKAAAKDILEELPVLFCPNCLSELDEIQIQKGLCPNCSKKTQEEKIINSATLKKTISDSILEAKEIKQFKINELAMIEKEISLIQEGIIERKKVIFEKNQEINNLIYKAVYEIKQRLEYIITREQLLLKYKKIVDDIEKHKKIKAEINQCMVKLKEELLDVDNKASLSMKLFDSFKNNFARYLGYMFDEISTCSFDENYMPIIDNSKITNVASASLKVAIRLAYMLALFNEGVETVEGSSHLGLLFLDSPKDKELDDDRFESFLKAIEKECAGQIIITGSFGDNELYSRNLKNARFFDTLTTNNKLLKKQ